jgi:methylmalonyl-CoA mutase
MEQDVQKANKIARRALDNGADALEITLDVRRTEGNIGGDLQGVAIQNQAGFEALVNGIDMEETPLHFRAGMSSPILLAMLYNKCEADDLDSSAISGSLLFDPYAFVITNGLLPKDEPAFINEARQMVAFCRRRLPQVRCLGVKAGVYHNAGGTIVQEIGYALATGNEYMATLSEAGLVDTDTIASAIHFNFAVGSRYFLEIAKFRAFRNLWRRVLDAYEVNEKQRAYLHSSSSRWNKTVSDPYMNMIRSTTEGIAAAIAGCDSVTLHPFDETFRLPDAFSRRMARNSQVIAKEEAYLDKVADPAAGSYYIETLTDKIAKAAWDCFQEIEEQGGMLKSIRGGYPQSTIAEASERRDQAIAERERIFVGANKYHDPHEHVPDIRSKPVVSLLETGQKANIDHTQLMSTLAKALREGCALGDLVPEVFDLHRENIHPIVPYRSNYK